MHTRFGIKILFLAIFVVSIAVAALATRSVQIRCNLGPVSISDMSGGIQTGDMVSVHGQLPNDDWECAARKVLVSSGERYASENGDTIIYVEVEIPMVGTWRTGKYKNYTVEMVQRRNL